MERLRGIARQCSLGLGSRLGCCAPSADKRRSPSAATALEIDLDVWWRDWAIYWTDHLQSTGGAGIPREAGRPRPQLAVREPGGTPGTGEAGLSYSKETVFLSDSAEARKVSSLVELINLLVIGLSMADGF